jgi:hypothetical protein
LWLGVGLRYCTNADTTFQASVNTPVADAPVTVGVVSASAQERRPSYDYNVCT